ncbi:MAG: precorrin-6Y C5,15-methyltransferase (decarboxylating) subunit CbiT, partial [Pseudobutyrivibrio sp.]|nr:precorrin-6Y C5,15-methyltransferase (decarboxylating) subunit CbiT [Pseudobutyrivibrio sp.]
IAMQGPFSKAMNRIQLKETNAKIMVLKSSGKSSGEAERINAAKEEGVQCFIIKRPDDSAKGLSNEDAIKKLEEVLQVSLKPNAFSEITPDVKCHITLAGFGMGFGSITEEVKEAIQNADIIFGAARMLSSIECKGKKYPYYLAKDIMPVLNERIEALPYGILNALVLFSGDTGFYSGTKKLRDALKADGRIKVTVMPGISSVSALASRIGESYDDAVVMSCHGIEESVWQPKLIDATLHNAKVFTLTSGGKDVRIIGEILCKLEEDYGVKYEIVAGVNLYSYEKIVTLSAMKCATFPEDGLVVLMIKNKKTITRRLSPGLSDDVFLRNKTPMSKEEIRSLSICKLGLTENAVVYDIGGGSGSVSVEIGLLHPSINVYTVEFKEEACKLIRANINKFNLKNVKLYEGVAPEALENLPAPTHVFIGGSGGRLEEILRTIKAKGNNTRVVINAVTLETIAEVNGILKDYAISDADVVQVAISKAKTVGDYNVMQAQNPVYVVSFSL